MSQSESSIKKVCRVNLGPMVNPDGSNHWFGYADADTWKPEVMDNLSARWGKSRRTSTGIIYKTNGNIFLHFSSWLIGLRARRPKLYPPL